MAITLSITQDEINTVLGNFLISVLPAGVSIVAGQINRVPEPSGSDFVEMTPIFQDRFATNNDQYIPALFQGSISGVTLNIASAIVGKVQVGSTIYGPGVSANTVITALGTGIGGVGTYTVNNSQTVGSSELQAGTNVVEQDTEVTIQLDVHGPNSSDNSQIITTLFRDQYATNFFTDAGYDMAPLYVEGPRQMPFVNGEQQVEYRYVVDVVLQVNPIITLPQAAATVFNINGIYDVL
jgi:hypothetical protein